MTAQEQADRTAAGGPCCAASRGTSPAAVADEAIETTTTASDGDVNDGMVLLPGGEFLMGTDDREGYPADGEGPVRKFA